MNPDELRALADALSSGTHYVESPELHEAMIRAADYLRRCADAQPAAWRCEVRGDGCVPKLGAVGWRHYHTTTSEREVLAFVTRYGNGIEGRAVPLYTHPAPAAPQAEPKLGELMREQRNSRVVAGAYPDGNPNAGAMMAQTSQAEPKREALSDDEILDILDIATAADLRFSMYSDDVETRAAIKRLACAIERAHGISGGSDAE